ncbi:MFS transporter [Nocardiopsis tropica]|jgi:fucose permease|uniref:MFS transporter n=1 Tax=Nocardiopsis tropica TaxID=109330 RepID=A0ABU7L2Z1_9ACTN|nr:MFS transporter [Nocardiopsis umidischolae]MEE2055634.1 MFS transporter [Nocardiopsis umidischolae]
MTGTTANSGKTAVYAAFAANGVMYAALVSRVPALGAELGLSTAELGLLLLWLSAGAVSGLPAAGLLVQRLGGSRGITAGISLAAAGLLALAVGLGTASWPLTAAALFSVGLGMGLWEVGMNVVGSRTAHLIGSESLVPRLHAALSLGTVAGALLGALLAGMSVPLSGQNTVMAGLLVLTAFLLKRFTRGGEAGGKSGAGRAPGGVLLASWRERRTLLIGLCVLGFAFAEGTANEWIAYVLVDGYGAAEHTGALAFAAFVAAMTAGRLTGGALVARIGRVGVLRLSVGLALGGVLVVAFGNAVAWALVGALLWGLGAAMGFPVGIAAAADDPERAAARVSVISSLGYAAFLGGPPLLGLLGGLYGIQQAILVVCAALVPAFLASGATRRITAPGKVVGPGRPR